MPSLATPRVMQEALTEAIIDRGCVELERLAALRSKGWQAEKLDEVFTRQRHTADNADDRLNKTWCKRSNTVMREIDDYARCIPPMGSVRFLDLGCCPGGFTSYVLQHNRWARGVGVSLPVDEGGHKFVLGAHLRNRFHLHLADMTSFFQLGPSFSDHPRLRPAPAQMKPASFDLVLLDGHQLRTQKSDYSAPWDIDRLLISQIILAFQSVRTGGNMVVTLTHPNRVLTAQILYILDVISENLATFKPRTMHMTRGSFYAIATGVGKGAEGAKMPRMIRALQELWVETTFGGEKGNGRYIKSSDLGFAISTEELKATYLERLIELGKDVWDFQAQSLEEWFLHKGIF